MSPSAFASPGLLSLPGRPLARPQLCRLQMSAAHAPSVATALSPAREQAAFRRRHGPGAAIAPSFSAHLAACAPHADSPDFSSVAVRSLLGNAHVYDVDHASLQPAFARFAKSRDVRELVRDVACSALFRARFMEPNSSLRFVEICFKTLLGRGPSSQAEVSEKIQMLADGTVSYEDYIGSFVDCGEYARKFGQALLPTFEAPGGHYANGMVGFMSNMKVRATSRGGGTDATPLTALSESVVGAGCAAPSAYVTAGYRTLLSQYEGFTVAKMPKSVLERNYGATLLSIGAASRWRSSGNRRPSGSDNRPWKSGWAPQAKDSWRAGWTPPGKKYT